MNSVSSNQLIFSLINPNDLSRALNTPKTGLYIHCHKIAVITSAMAHGIKTVARTKALPLKFIFKTSAIPIPNKNWKKTHDKEKTTVI